MTPDPAAPASAAPPPVDWLQLQRLVESWWSWYDQTLAHLGDEGPPADLVVSSFAAMHATAPAPSAPTPPADGEWRELKRLSEMDFLPIPLSNFPLNSEVSMDYIEGWSAAFRTCQVMLRNALAAANPTTTRATCRHRHRHRHAARGVDNSFTKGMHHDC